MKGSFWLFCAISSFLCLACENEIVKNKTNITGYWMVQKAFRDKRETRLLADVFFQFEEGGKMVTNLPNTSDGVTDFEIKGDQIIQKAPTPIVYNIQGISDSTLVLAMEMNNTPFEIHLKKATPPPVDSLTMPVDSLQ